MPLPTTAATAGSKTDMYNRAFSQNDYGAHLNNHTMRISSNNIIQAPLLISSEDFKIRKLNPNKLYNALKSYYQESFEQD